MRRAFWLLSLALIVIPAVAFAGVRVALPGGTPLKVRLVDSISSGSATVGETFAFKADQDGRRERLGCYCERCAWARRGRFSRARGWARALGQPGREVQLYLWRRRIEN